MSEVLSTDVLVHVSIVLNRPDILALTPLLQRFAAACGQTGAMGWMSYFLSVPDIDRKTPYLVLITNKAAQPNELRLEDLRAAVLLLEYRIAGLSTGVVCTDDSSALRTLIAHPDERASMALVAAQAMIERGAHVVLCTYDDTACSVEVAAAQLGERGCTAQPLLWAERRRPVARTLRLAETLDATLASLGKSTRFNLRYYRRRLLAAMPCTFVADARGMLSESDLRAVNANCLNPVAFDLLKLQYASACELPEGFLIGLRGPEGEWLSLIGGWRQADATVLHWQANASGYEQLSIGTVMRSYFIEAEIARGSRSLSFYGGTPHSMAHSFVPDVATDLMVRRRSWRAALLVVGARIVLASQSRKGGHNFLLETLSALSGTWQPVARTDADRAGRAVPSLSPSRWSALCRLCNGYRV